MLISGPGIAPNSTLDHFVGSHVDLAPTWLAMAGLGRASEMDGSSLLHSLIPDPSASAVPLPLSTRLRLDAQPAAPSNRLAYLEYHGLGNVPPSYVDPLTTPNIRLMDCFNNTFRALRFVGHPTFGNLLFAEFGSDFLFEGKLALTEIYDMSVDPWNTRNIAESFDPSHAEVLHELLVGLWGCKGSACAAFINAAVSPTIKSDDDSVVAPCTNNTDLPGADLHAWPHSNLTSCAASCEAAAACVAWIFGSCGGYDMCYLKRSAGAPTAKPCVCSHAMPGRKPGPGPSPAPPAPPPPVPPPPPAPPAQPLAPPVYRAARLGTVAPRGWMASQLGSQTKGLSGHKQIGGGVHASAAAWINGSGYDGFAEAWPCKRQDTAISRL